VVSNGVAPAATSAGATLTVNPVTQSTAVSFDAQPSPQVQPVGGEAVFAVAASGTGPFSYQWLKGGVAISGQTSAVLRITALNGGDAGNYSVTVTGALGPVTSNIVALTVLGTPVITSQPQASTVTAGSTATFSVTATPSNLSYMWLRNGVPVNGATGAQYTTPVLTTGDSGADYSVVVYNAAGATVSNLAVLTVNSPILYFVNVYASYLNNGPVTLQNVTSGGIELLTIDPDYTRSFPTGVPDGGNYSVSVLTPPTGQTTCTVLYGTGVASASNWGMSSMRVTCQ
jgi:hypothetical protein